MIWIFLDPYLPPCHQESHFNEPPHLIMEVVAFPPVFERRSF